MTFQSSPTHLSSKVFVYQLSVTGVLEPSPARPNNDEYQTETLAFELSKSTTFVPTGFVREMKLLPSGASPDSSSPIFLRKPGSE